MLHRRRPRHSDRRFVSLLTRVAALVAALAGCDSPDRDAVPADPRAAPGTAPDRTTGALGEPRPGDQCAGATAILTVPFEAPRPSEGPDDPGGTTPSTVGMANDYDVVAPATHCGFASGGANSADLAYRFTAPTFGSYRFQLTFDRGFAAGGHLIVVDTCDTHIARCLAGAQRVSPGVLRVSVTLDEGQEVYAIVDGRGGDAGGFTLKAALVGSAPPEVTDAELPAYDGSNLRLAAGRPRDYAIRLTLNAFCVGQPTGACMRSAADWRLLLNGVFDSAFASPSAFAYFKKRAVDDPAHYFYPQVSSDPGDRAFPLFALIFGNPFAYFGERLDPVYDDPAMGTYSARSFSRTTGEQDPQQIAGSFVHPSEWAIEVDPSGPAGFVPVALTKDALIAAASTDAVHDVPSDPLFAPMASPEFAYASFASVFRAGRGPRYLGTVQGLRRPDAYGRNEGLAWPARDTASQGTGGNGALMASALSPTIPHPVAPALKWLFRSWQDCDPAHVATCPGPFTTVYMRRGADPANWTSRRRRASSAAPSPISSMDWA